MKILGAAILTGNHVKRRRTNWIQTEAASGMGQGAKPPNVA